MLTVLGVNKPLEKLSLQSWKKKNLKIVLCAKGFTWVSFGGL